jgi:hypothetical protein
LFLERKNKPFTEIVLRWCEIIFNLFSTSFGKIENVFGRGLRLLFQNFHLRKLELLSACGSNIPLQLLQKSGMLEIHPPRAHESIRSARGLPLVGAGPGPLVEAGVGRSGGPGAMGGIGGVGGPGKGSGGVVEEPVGFADGVTGAKFTRCLPLVGGS